MENIRSDQNEVSLSSEDNGFYYYKNILDKREMFLYKVYDKNKCPTENTWILLERIDKRIETTKYTISSDFSMDISYDVIIKGDPTNGSYKLLYFLMLINGYSELFAVDENDIIILSMTAPIYGACPYNRWWRITVNFISPKNTIKADWEIKKDEEVTLYEIREREMFPFSLISLSIIPSSIVLSVIKYGLFNKTIAFCFTRVLSPLHTFASLPLAVLYSLPDNQIKIIIKNNGSIGLTRDEDIFFYEDIFTVLKEEGVPEDKICLQVKKTIMKALSLGLSMTNKEWRDFLSTIMFYSDEYSKESFSDLFLFILSVLPGEVISPERKEEESLLKMASYNMEESEWPQLFEEMKEREEYIYAYREKDYQ